MLSRLARSRSGNTVVILAAALVPMAAFVGAGFDMSRSYLVKSRLQTACDSGALAARRAMVGATWGTTTQTAADSYFDANFQTGRYGTTGLNRNFVSNDGETVRGTASVDVPTTIMKMFGNDVVNVDVNCQAIMNLPNTDVMFVLDTTGSMADTNPSDTVNRMTSLRTAVKNFHASIETAKSAGTQVRYGFVPYSSNVNVGRLLKRDWVVDRWTYQSRVADGSESVSAAASTNDVTNSTWWSAQPYPAQSLSSLSLENCYAPPDSLTYSSESVVSSTSVLTSGPPKGTIKTKVYQYTVNGLRYFLTKTATSCQLDTRTFVNYVERRTDVTQPVLSAASLSTLDMWSYEPVEFDVSSLKGSNANGTMAGGTVTAPIGNGFTDKIVNWSGCIEERDTVRETDYSTIPAGALDMDVDGVPVAGNAATQWRPALAGLVYFRMGPGDWRMGPERTSGNHWSVEDFGGGANAVCPAAASKLTSMSASSLNTYLDTLIPAGNTYHDIGMIWGLRLMSPTGLFATENALTPSGKQIVRHLIFMTDGETMTDIVDYDAYGLAALDRRRTNLASLPTNSATNDLVEARLAALCESAKGRNITVWVIAFGTSLTSMLEDCASEGSAFEADNSVELNTTFSEIASKIANLRLND
jgi:Flp pilus assembly protein TadG